jgi:hypothetical protein
MSAISFIRARRMMSEEYPRMPPPSSVRMSFRDHGDDVTKSAGVNDEAALDEGSAEAAYETRRAGLRDALVLKAE